MIIYCMSDIHGCLAEFENALSLVLDNIEQGKAKLVLLGDYIHGGPDNRGVLDRIMRLRASPSASTAVSIDNSIDLCYYE